LLLPQLLDHKAIEQHVMCRIK